MSIETRNEVSGRMPGEVDAVGFGWRRLQTVAAVGTLVSFVVPMLVTLSFEPFLAGMAAPFVIGLLVRLRWPRVGTVLLGFFSLAVLASGAPFLLDALSHPESIVDFLPLVLFTVSALVGTIAAIPAYRESAPPATTSAPARGLAVAGGAVLLAAAIVSVIAFMGVNSEEAQAGDVRLTAEDVEFAPEILTADAGSVAVHVTNQDGTRHTFTIDELGVDLNVPPDTTQRVSFDAPAGTYEFYCRPHSDVMTGTLTVR
jgi:plastocyanin